jgi:hypothetical protein
MDSDKIVQYTHCGDHFGLGINVILWCSYHKLKAMLNDAENMLNNILSLCMVKIEQFFVIFWSVMTRFY